jgi:hypothetical protein
MRSGVETPDEYVYENIGRWSSWTGCPVSFLDSFRGRLKYLLTWESGGITTFIRMPYVKALEEATALQFFGERAWSHSLVYQKLTLHRCNLKTRHLDLHRTWSRYICR